MDDALSNMVINVGVKQFIRNNLLEFLVNNKITTENTDAMTKACYDFILNQFISVLEKELLEIKESVDKEDNNARI